MIGAKAWQINKNYKLAMYRERRKGGGEGGGGLGRNQLIQPKG